MIHRPTHDPEDDPRNGSGQSYVRIASLIPWYELIRAAWIRERKVKQLMLAKGVRAEQNDNLGQFRSGMQSGRGWQAKGRDKPGPPF